MKKEQWTYFIYQIIIAIGSIIAMAFIIVDIIHFAPLCIGFRYSMNDLEPLFYKTSVGKVVAFMPITESNHFFLLVKEAILSFLRCLHPMCSVFLSFLCATLFLSFFLNHPHFQKQYRDYRQYILKLFIAYLAKFLVCAAVFGIAYSGSIRSIGIGLTIMGYVGILINLIMLFFLSLFVIKFIFSMRSIWIKTRENHQKID